MAHQAQSHGSGDKADPPRIEATEEHLDEKMRTAHELVREKYNSEVRFFTKDVFRDFVRYLERHENVRVTGLDGVRYQFRIRTGEDHPVQPDGEDRRAVFTKPRLKYRALEHLLDPRLPYSPLIYLPVSLEYPSEVLDTQAYEFMNVRPVLSYDAVKERFVQAGRSCESSNVIARLKSTLASCEIPPGINKIMALACDTMSDPNGDTNILAQHHLALVLRDFLSNPRYAAGTHGHGVATDIKCYAQDPEYRPVDEKVLSEAGFTVLEDPRALLEIDEASVVICFYPDFPIRQILADIARPAIIIWNKPRNINGSAFDPVSSRVLRMMEDYEELPFESRAWAPKAMYVRKKRPYPPPSHARAKEEEGD